MAPRGNDFPTTFVPCVAGETQPAPDSACKKRGKRRGKHPHNELTPQTIRKLPPGRHADGGTLYAFVRDTGACQWVQRLTIHGSRRDLGLGSFPLVSLAEARCKAFENRRLAHAGGDPTAEAAEAARKQAPTFRSVYEIATELRRPGWDTKATEASWHRGFEKHVLPVIGDKPVDAVTLAALRKIIGPLWDGPNSSGHKLRQDLEYVFAIAVGEQYRPDNPAAALKPYLPKVRKAPKHHASLPHAEIRQAMVEWQALSLNPSVRLALFFLVLTGARLTEATHATWSEIDRSKRVWRVLARRMKRRRGHDVALSWQALEVLAEAASLQPNDSLLFPMRRSRGEARPPSQRTMSDALRRLDRHDTEGHRITLHGFRTTFCTWAQECVPGSWEAAEIALAHDSPWRKSRACLVLARSNPYTEDPWQWARDRRRDRGRRCG